MKKIFQFIQVSVIVVILFVWGCSKQNNDSKQNQNQNRGQMTLDEILNNLSAMSFSALVPDSVIVNALNNLPTYSSYASGSARYEMYMFHLGPAFKSDKELFNALYCAYSLPHWDYYKLSKEALDKPLNTARRLMLETARTYLRNPENLKSLYQQKKPLLVSRFQSFNIEEKTRFLEWLKNAKSAMELFYNKEFQDKYRNYLKAEADLIESRLQENNSRAEYDEFFKNKIQGDSAINKEIRKRYCDVTDHADNDQWMMTETVPAEEKETYNAFRELDGKYTAQRIIRNKYFDEMRKAEQILSENNPDLFSFLFVGRRFLEGGKELVDAWIWIADDIICARIRLLTSSIALSQTGIDKIIRELKLRGIESYDLQKVELDNLQKELEIFLSNEEEFKELCKMCSQHAPYYIAE